MRTRSTMISHGPRSILLLATALSAAPAASAQRGVTTRVSVSSAGNQGNLYSTTTSISADGRYVAFQSPANNLVPGDTNAAVDIFVHDGTTAQTTRVSVDSAGIQGDDSSQSPSISADGRYVAFDSFAENLVIGDSNFDEDVFVHDRATGQTTRVSVDSAGSQANSYSTEPSISADGRYVAFVSFSDTLVPGDTNVCEDIFVHDRATGQTTRVSVDSAGTQGNLESDTPSVSDDGRYVAFMSRAENLVPEDTNGDRDIFVHDRATGQTTRVSVDSAGSQGNGSSWEPSISADGRWVAFWSQAYNLVLEDTNLIVDVFLHDRFTAQTARVSVDSMGVQGNLGSRTPSVSADGHFVAFASDATNLVPGDSNDAGDIFVHDRITGQTARRSVSSAGGQANDDSGGPSLSATGRLVAFESWAFNLVSHDNNGAIDVFVHDEFDCTSEAHCIPKLSSHLCIPSILGTGNASLADPSGFTLSTTQMESQQNALTFFGVSGAASVPFQGSALCVQPPIYRLNPQNAAGSGDCQGAISYTLADILAHATGGALVEAGTLVNCQTWGRDPDDPFGTSLSDAWQFLACP